MQCQADPPQRRTFRLRHGTIGVHHRAHVYGLPQLLQRHIAR